MLSTGVIATGELLRMTAPRTTAALTSPPAPMERAPAPAPAAAAAAAVAADPIPLPKDPAPVPREAHPDIATGLTEIEQLADDVNTAGDAARKVTILGTAANESITLTALTLARLVARNSRVVVVGLSASSSEISAISAASVDPDAPGLAELMLGETSFSHVITRDRSSRVHLVSAGRPGSDRALLQSPRLALAIDALLRVYDHVLLDAGTASDLPAELLTAQARAVVVPDPSMTADARTSMCDQLRAAGCFTELTLLSKPLQPSDAMEAGARVVAA
jgi:polysaccharide biosynthesis transport protein